MVLDEPITPSRADYEYTLFVVMMALFAVCGAVGNILIIAIYFVNTRAFAMRKYILTLSVVDLIICVVLIPYTILFEFNLVSDDVSCHGMEVMRHSLVIFSNLILLLIAGERLLMVWKPMEKKLNERMKTVFILSLLLASVISSIPAAMIFEVKSHSHHNSTESATNTKNSTLKIGNETVTPEYCRYTSSFLGKTGSGIYRDFLSFLFTAELLLLVVSYIIVYILLYTHKKRLRHSMSLNGSHPKNSTAQREKENNPSPPETIPMRCTQTESQEITVHSTPENEVGSTTVHEFSTASYGSGMDETRRRGGGRNLRRKHGVPKTYVSRKTWTMMFVCTFIYVLCWIPFFLAVFNVYDLLIFRYFFFLGHAANPIVYSIVNDKVRTAIQGLLTKTVRTCINCFSRN